MLSFVVPAYNEELELPATIAEIRDAAQDRQYEIIVVDDASTDATSTVAQNAGAKIVSINRRQIAAARNAGARRARGEILFFVDADTKLKSSAMAAMPGMDHGSMPGMDHEHLMQVAAASQPAPVGANLQGMAIDPSGRWAYVTNQQASTVLEYAIDPSTGALSALSSPMIAAGSSPAFIALNPQGSYAYVANTGACTTSQYAIGAGGVLSALTPPSVPSGDCVANDAISFLAVDPSGGFVIVPDVTTPNTGSKVVHFAVAAGGGLTPFSPPTTSIASAQPERITFLTAYH